jgi:SAM-dependent methyltransferase
LDRYYPCLENGVRYRDGTEPFYAWILKSIDCNTATILNIGAGSTPPPHRSLRGRVHRLLGVDPDGCVLQNTDLDEAYVNDGVHLPFRDEFFDGAFSDWTVEHVERPADFLREIYRVLKPGAPYMFRTTNLCHYVTLSSWVTPQWFHAKVANRVRGLAADQHDPWPTYYKLNTSQTIRRTLSNAGFDRHEIRMIESYPSYLVFSSLLFLLGVSYERLVNRFASLSIARQIILVKATK